MALIRFEGNEVVGFNLHILHDPLDGGDANGVLFQEIAQLIQLATMVDNDFSCRASVQTLATAISKKNGAARRALHILENLGLITCHSQFGANGSRLANRYKINHPDAHHLARPREPKNSDAVPPTDMETAAL